MAKIGSKVSDFRDDVEDKIREAQERVHHARGGVANHSKRDTSVRRDLDAFKAGMKRIEGEPAPLIADHLKDLEKSAVNVAEDKQRATLELTVAEKDLADLTRARDQLKQMRD
jgi:hypothetical protein